LKSAPFLQKPCNHEWELHGDLEKWRKKEKIFKEV